VTLGTKPVTLVFRAPLQRESYNAGTPPVENNHSIRSFSPLMAAILKV